MLTMEVVRRRMTGLTTFTEGSTISARREMMGMGNHPIADTYSK
jgi:hypothetical protein